MGGGGVGFGRLKAYNIDFKDTTLILRTIMLGSFYFCSGKIVCLKKICFINILQKSRLRWKTTADWFCGGWLSQYLKLANVNSVAVKPRIWFFGKIKNGQFSHELRHADSVVWGGTRD